MQSCNSEEHDSQLVIDANKPIQEDTNCNSVQVYFSVYTEIPIILVTAFLTIMICII